MPNPVNPQNLNRYAYVSNNPISFIDPSGHCGGEASLNWDSNSGTHVWTFTSDYQTCNDLRENLEEMYEIEIRWDEWILQEIEWLELAVFDILKSQQ